MGQTLSTTRFVDDERIVAQSYHSCQLFGDPDLYGLGIRIAFYLQYLAVTFALLTTSTASLPFLRAGLTVLTLGLFVTLCTTSTGGGLVVLDWYIAIALTAPYVFLTDIFARVALVRAYLHRRHQGEVSVEELIDDNTTGPAGPRRRELMEATLSIIRAHHALSDALDRCKSADDELTAVRHALVDFGRAARDSPEVAARYSLDKIARATSSPHDAYPLEKMRLEADLLRACLGTGMTHSEAAPATHSVMTSAKREYSAARARQTALEVREGLHAARFRDVFAVSVVCIAWAGFQLARPWLYWEGLGRGGEEGCDVQLMWFFVPTSAYGEKFGIWLKVWGVFMAVIGAAAFSYGVMLLGKNMFVAGKKGRAGALFSDVESQRTLLDMSEISGSSPIIPESGRRHRRGRPSRPCRIYFRCIGVLQFLALGVVAGMVEVTIWANDLDMGKADVRMSSQIFALVVGAVASVPVYWECLVMMPLRSVARRGVRSE